MPPVQRTSASLLLFAKKHAWRRTVDGDTAVANIDAGRVVGADGEDGLVMHLRTDEPLALSYHRARVHHLHRERRTCPRIGRTQRLARTVNGGHLYICTSLYTE